MDPTSFGSLTGGAGGSTGGLIAALQRQFGGAPAAAPAVPSDGAMQPTIGPGMPAPGAAPAAYTPKMGLPKGGILGLMQGQSPNGIMGLLKHLQGPQGAPLAGAMPQAGMLGAPGQFPVPAPDGSATPAPGLPGSAYEGPAAPQIPQNYNPADNIG